MADDRLGCASCKGGVFQWVKGPPGIKLPDTRAERTGYLRIIDESGEDYLSQCYVAAERPVSTQRAVYKPPSGGSSGNVSARSRIGDRKADINQRRVGVDGVSSPAISIRGTAGGQTRTVAMMK